MTVPASLPKKAEPASRRERKEDSYQFPDGGWECSKCQNYNFKGRKNCHRCKKPKSTDDYEGKPEHMLLSTTEKSVVKSKNRKNPNRRQQHKENEKVATEPKGNDWICQRCFNHNYSFR